MPVIQNFISRRDDNGGSDKVVNLLIVFMGLLFTALLLVAVLVLVRRTRRQQAMLDQAVLPQYNDVKRTSNHRRLTIQTATGRQSIVFYNKDGEPMLTNPNSPPHSPENVPEIHITFPDESDESGRPKSGRVVVVCVGDSSVGLEPVNDEQLPAYEKESSTGFYSVDMDSVGGLQEKDRRQFV